MRGPERRDRPFPVGPESFQTTSWSLVLAVRDGDPVQSRAALATLCAAYWYPLYAFIRRKGHDADEALDLVQGFFARLLEKGDLAAIDRGKGKFRSFLMAACGHYLANQRDHARAVKRGGGLTPIPIDRIAAEGRYGGEPAHDLTAERLFERQWATTLLELVLGRLEDEMARAGKAVQFEALRPALTGDGSRMPYGQVGAVLGMSEEAARAAAHRLRNRYRELIREEIGRTVDDPSEIDGEIASLFTALSS
jgi:RNA polymerase sigma-70 factor (ECF subfamily)